MDELRILLKKYWEAETTLQEEARLRQAGVLRYFDEAPELSEHFDRRVLSALNAETGDEVSSIGYGRGWLAAAATIGVLVTVLWGTEVKAPRQAGNPQAPVADTYQTPEQAFAAVQKALLTVSVRMNEGQVLTEKEMEKVKENWKTVIHD